MQRSSENTTSSEATRFTLRRMRRSAESELLSSFHDRGDSNDSLSSSSSSSSGDGHRSTDQGRAADLDSSSIESYENSGQLSAASGTVDGTGVGRETGGSTGSGSSWHSSQLQMANGDDEFSEAWTTDDSPDRVFGGHSLELEMGHSDDRSSQTASNCDSSESARASHPYVGQTLDESTSRKEEEEMLLRRNTLSSNESTRSTGSENDEWANEKKRSFAQRSSDGVRNGLYPMDTYSFLSLYGPRNGPIFFGVGMMVFLFQMLLFLLMLLGALHPQQRTEHGNDPGNGTIARIVGGNASPILQATQFIALTCYAIFAQASVLDITTAVETFPKFSEVSSWHEGRSQVFSCTLRLLQGITGIFTALLLVITSETAVNIILYLIAINFISNLGKVAFDIALKGKYGPRLEDEALRISNLRLPHYMSPLDKCTRFRCTIAILVINFFVFLGAIVMIAKRNPIIGTLPEAFVETIKTGTGSVEPHMRGKKCIDPTTVPLTILFGELIEPFGYEGKSIDYPDVMLECDGKAVLSVVLNEDTIHSAKTVCVNDRADCVMTVKNQTSENQKMWHVYYSIFIGYTTASDRKIIEGNSVEDGVVPFFTVPDCMMERLSKHVDMHATYSDANSKEALRWIVKDETGNSNCKDRFFIERFALNALSFGAPIANSTIPSWTDTNKTCLWPVITCTNGVPTELDLRLLELQGSIPTSIGLLSSFSRIVLDNNALTGTIPSEVGLLTRLRSFDLHHNALSGIIPTELGHLTRLTGLNLYANDLTGNIPSEVGKLTRINNLLLTNNTLTGNIPSEIGFLTSFAMFDLSFHYLTGTIPSDIGEMIDLQDVRLNYNALSGSIPNQIGAWTNLRSIYLDHNWLSGPLSSDFGNWTKLKYLSFDSNVLTGNIPTEFGLMTRLVRMNLDKNALIGNIPSEIGGLISLEGLALSQNDLTGTIPSEIGMLTSLHYLGFGDNNLEGSIPSEIGNLKGLFHLGLDFNELTGSIPSDIGHICNSTSILLSENSLTGIIPSEIGLLTILERLELVSNLLTGTIPSEIGGLMNLVGLAFSDNSLTGNIPIDIGNLVNLLYMSLGNNALTGTIPSEMGNLEDLEFLDLASNRLTGSIPSEIGNLQSLTILDLRYNLLTGAVPSELALLTSVQCLHISEGNNFVSIPDKVEEMLCNRNPQL